MPTSNAGSPSAARAGSSTSFVRDLAPLIVTAELPEALQSRADQLRREHFPPERNHLNAHVTLFHAIPAPYEDELKDVLAAEARAEVEKMLAVKRRNLTTLEGLAAPAPQPASA